MVLILSTIRTVIILIIFTVITVCQAKLSVDTPTNAVTCQNTLITWSGGAANDSYILEIAGGYTNIAVTNNLRNPYWNWFVNFPANTQASISVYCTSTREVANSANFIVQAGDDQTCTTSIPLPVSSTPDPGSASRTPAVANSSETSTSSVSSGGVTGTSGSLTSQSNATSLLPLPPLLSRTNTGTSSDPTGVSSPLVGDTSPPSGSPNVGLIAGAAGSGSVVLILLLLVICLYRRRKRLAEVVGQVHPLETKVEETLSFTRHHPTYSRYDSTTPMVTPYPSTKSHESSALTSQRLHSEPRIIALPLMTSGHDIAIALVTPASNTTTTPSYNLAVPSAITPRYDAAGWSATSEPIEEPPPMYRDEAEVQIQSQRIRAEETERVRRYDALIADFCASNRDLISPALERKLYAARYLPEDNPSDVTADYWLATYGVGSLDLRRLQTAYERHVAT